MRIQVLVFHNFFLKIVCICALFCWYVSFHWLCYERANICWMVVHDIVRRVEKMLKFWWLLLLQWKCICWRYHCLFIYCTWFVALLAFHKVHFLNVIYNLIFILGVKCAWIRQICALNYDEGYALMAMKL